MRVQKININSFGLFGIIQWNMSQNRKLNQSILHNYVSM